MHAFVLYAPFLLFLCGLVEGVKKVPVNRAFERARTARWGETQLSAPSPSSRRISHSITLPSTFVIDLEDGEVDKESGALESAMDSDNGERKREKKEKKRKEKGEGQVAVVFISNSSSDEDFDSEG